MNNACTSRTSSLPLPHFVPGDCFFGDGSSPAAISPIATSIERKSFLTSTKQTRACAINRYTSPPPSCDPREFPNISLREKTFFNPSPASVGCLESSRPRLGKTPNMSTDSTPFAAGSLALGSTAKPKIAWAWFTIPFAFLSSLAVGIVAAISFACYGVSLVLAKVPPLRIAYEFLSQTYDRFIARLGAVVLRDPRDAPALRLMLSLSLTTVPIFVAQLFFHRPQPLLVVAFYVSLYGSKFHRFIRLFSAKHLEAHRKYGYFNRRFDKIFGRYFEFFIGYFYGNVPELDRTVHVRLHHKENGGFDDTAQSREYDRSSRADFLRYLANNVGTVLGTLPYSYFRERGDELNRRRLFWGMARYYAFFAAVFIFNWRIGIFYVLIPLLAMNFITAITAWIQHAFYDPQRPEDYFAHTVTVLDHINFMNEGYHLCHHHRAGMHWSEMPEHFDRIRDKMKDSGSLVFRDLDFMDLFMELTLLRRMDVLAEKLIPWEPMDRAERLDLLAKRTGLGAPG